MHVLARLALVQAFTCAALLSLGCGGNATDGTAQGGTGNISVGGSAAGGSTGGAGNVGGSGTGGKATGGASIGGTTGAKACGARAGNTCTANEYCAYEPGQYCGQADAESVCRLRPQVCDTVYAPVCGCDRQTYGNSCEAATAGTGVYATGACTN